MWDAPALSLFDGALDRARDLTGTARELTLTLPPAVTGALLTRVAAAFHAGINDVLLTALALAVMDWCRRHGRGGDAHAVLVDVEGHGREEFGAGSAGLDLSRTVGWFTSLFPVRLDPGARSDLDDALAGGDAIGQALKTIKEQLRALPDRGLGYGLLRYLNPQTAPRLAQLPAPQIGFNYLGRFAAPGTADWASAPEAIPLGGGDPALALAHAIEVNALTLDGADGPSLTATWTWAPALMSEDMVRDLAQGWFRALSALAAHAERPGAGGRTPGDLPLVPLTQGEIEEIERHYRRIDDILPLAPLAGGPAVPCALRRAGARRLYDPARSRPRGRARRRRAGAGGARTHCASRQSARRLPAGGPGPARAGDRAGRAAALDRHRPVGAGRGRTRNSGSARSRPQERAERFDLAAPPLIRFALIRLAS